MAIEVDFIIHPGYGKTGTSWIQEFALPNLEILNIGKNKKNNKNINKKKNEVFVPIYRPLDYLKKYKIYNYHIEKYADLLCKKIFKNIQMVKKKKIIFFSDENIFGFGGIYINAINLKLLIEIIKKKLKKKFNLNVIILLTIRDQATYLGSFYGYDYSIQKNFFSNFQEFINYGIQNPYSKKFGDLMYYENYNLLKLILPANYKINIVPYEILNKYPHLFLKEIFRFNKKTNIKKLRLDFFEKNKKKINSNFTKKNSGNWILKENFLLSLLNKIYIYEEKIKNMLIGKPKIKKYLKLLFNHLKSNQNYTSTQFISLKKNDLIKIKKIYKNSNLKLLDYLSPFSKKFVFNYTKNIKYK